MQKKSCIHSVTCESTHLLPFTGDIFWLVGVFLLLFLQPVQRLDMSLQHAEKKNEQKTMTFFFF